jgi:hypothetical protein
MKIYIIEFDMKIFTYGVDELLVAAKNLTQAREMAEKHLAWYDDQLDGYYIHRIPRARIKAKEPTTLNETYHFE